jgi:hypothetical protein
MATFALFKKNRSVLDQPGLRIQALAQNPLIITNHILHNKNTCTRFLYICHMGKCLYAHQCLIMWSISWNEYVFEILWFAGSHKFLASFVEVFARISELGFEVPKLTLSPILVARIEQLHTCPKKELEYWTCVLCVCSSAHTCNKISRCLLHWIWFLKW